MTSTWVSVPLREVATFLSGGTPRKSDPEYWSGDIPWISGATLHETRLSRSDRMVTQAAIGNGTRLAPVDSTLILVRGMSLLDEIRIGRAVREVAFNQDVKALVPDRRRVDPFFLTYSLLARRPDLQAMVHLAGHGTGVLGTDRLASLSLDLPQLDEQRRIAGVLGALDDLIEVNRSVVRDCEGLAQALAASGVESTALSAFTSWGGLAAVKPAGVVDHYSLPAFDAGREPERVDGSAIKSNKQKLLGPCVLVARLNPHIPRVWMVYPDEVFSSLASTEFVPIVGAGVPDEVVYAVCSAPGYLEQMNGFVAGTTGSHQRVDKDALTSVQVPDVRLLPTSVRDAIVALVRQTHACREEIKELAATRDDLLPLLMSGKVRVSEVAA